MSVPNTPPSRRIGQGPLATVLALGLLALLGAALLVVFLTKDDPNPGQPGEQAAREEQPPIREKDPPRETVQAEPAREPSHEDRILGHGLHPDPPPVEQHYEKSEASQEIPAPVPEMLPAPKKLPADPKPPEVKPPVSVKPAEVPDPPRPREDTRPKVAEKPPVPKPDANAEFEKRLARSESDLRDELAKAPELRVLTDLEVKMLREAGGAGGVRPNPLANGLAVSLQQQQAMYQKGLKAGLPLRAGPTTRLDAKTALAVQTVSKELRDMGFVSIPGATSQVRLATGRVLRVGATTIAGGSPKEKVDAFKTWCDENRVEKYPGALATMLQMLQVEDEVIRLLLVREMARSKVPGSSVVLAMRALTDPSPKVRQAAVTALKKRPASEYQRVLLQGFAYPWPPVADHAAQAMATLDLKDSAPQLVKLLDMPNPSQPVFDPKTRKRTVREMVRLNHMRNCLLCHPPAASKNDGLVHGTIPIPGQPLPPAYYAERNGNAVRADTTFLRQDFSLSLPVENTAPWPDEQRFDFVVRQRVVPADKEVEAKPAGASFPQREALTYTLRKLTGKDGGDSRQKWEQLLGIKSSDGKDTGSDPVVDTRTKEEIAQLDKKAMPFLRFAKKLIDTGEVDKAKERLDEIIKEYPGTPSAIEAKRLRKGLDKKGEASPPRP
jgi:outer membrane biosynthesis protein TonB